MRDCLYSPAQISNSMLKLAKKKLVSIDPLKLQKLIFFAHGWSLSLDNIGLINEPFYAWRFGPVVGSVYHEFKHYGNNEIKHFMSELVECEPNNYSWSSTFITEDKQETLLLLEKILEHYGQFTGSQLSHMTHQDGSPWDLTFKRGVTEGIACGKEILNQDIKIYFDKLASSENLLD